MYASTTGDDVSTIDDNLDIDSLITVFKKVTEWTAMPSRILVATSNKLMNVIQL